MTGSLLDVIPRHAMPILLTTSLVAATLLFMAGDVRARDGSLTPIDSIVAVVDAQPIFRSDLDRAKALGGIAADPGEDESTLRRRILDQLIDRRLRLAEATHTGPKAVSRGEIEVQIDRLAETAGGTEALTRRLETLDMDRAELERTLTEQLRVLRFIDERLRPRALVREDEIVDHYTREVQVAAERDGRPVPSFESVRGAIRTLLEERRLDEEITRWTADLRSRADVVLLLDDPRPLPPVSRP